MSVTRIPEESLAVLRELAELQGESQQSILAKAIEAYRRSVFLERLNESFARLRQDEPGWREENAERTAWDEALADNDDT